MDTLRRWAVLVELQAKMLLRNRQTLVASLGLALVSMLIFGSLLNQNGAGLRIAMVNEDGSPVAAQVVTAFSGVDGVTVATFTESAVALNTLKAGDAAAVVVLPTGFGRDLLAGKATAQVYYDGSNPQRGGQAQAVIAGVFGGVNKAILGVTEPISLQVESVERRVIRQIDWLTPGMAGMMIMWANLAVGAIMIAWREQGLLKRLATTPLRSSTLMITQIAARLLFSILQVAVLLVVARVAFGVQVMGSYWVLGLLVIVATLAILAFGLLIGAFVAKSDGAQAITTLIAFPMMFLGGSYFDTSAAPAFMQPLVQVLPLTHINDALRQVMLYGAGFQAIQQPLLILLAWMVGSLLVATRAFRWNTR